MHTLAVIEPMVAPGYRMPDVPVVLEAGDRFWRIISSGDLRMPGPPPYTSVIVFFCVLRRSGAYDIICVNKIFEASGNIRRTAQTKAGLHADRIEAELVAIRTEFAGGVEAATGLRIEWKGLDLADVTDPEEQVRRMEAWPGLGAWRSEG